MCKNRFIRINNNEIAVSKEVYLAFKRPAWVERKRRRIRENKERSLEVFMEDGFDIPSEQALVDEIIADKLLLEELYVALSELTHYELGLINALFFEKKSERIVAAEYGVQRNTIVYHRDKILDKLRKILKKF